MSGFLLNLARRGAGLIEAPVEASPAPSVAAEIGGRRDELPEAQSTAAEDHPAAAGGEAPVQTNSTQKVAGFPADSSSRNAVSNQPSTIIQRASATPAMPAFAVGKPSRDAGPARAQPPSLMGRETRRATMKESNAPGAGRAPEVVETAKRPASTAQLPMAQGAITAIRIERGEAVPDPAARKKLGPPRLRPSPASEIALGSQATTPAPRQTPALPAKGATGQSPDSSAGSLRAASDEPRELAVSSPRILPAPEGFHARLPFQKAPRALPPERPSQLPIHVRIGRVEVLPATPPAAPPTAPARPLPQAGLGFKSYARVRNYRY